MKMRMNKNDGYSPLPNSRKSWCKEIATAYCDARETIPFSNMTGQPMSEKELFHLAPVICLKIRGIKRTEANRKKATEAALSSYVASEEMVGDLFNIPQMSFAFCYVVSHLGLDLLTQEQASDIIEGIEHDLLDLIEMTKQK